MNSGEELIASYVAWIREEGPEPMLGGPAPAMPAPGEAPGAAAIPPGMVRAIINISRQDVQLIELLADRSKVSRATIIREAMRRRQRNRWRGSGIEHGAELIKVTTFLEEASCELIRKEQKQGSTSAAVLHEAIMLLAQELLR